MNTWKIFKKFYELFEGFITQYLKDSKDHKDSVYYFLSRMLIIISISRGKSEQFLKSSSREFIKFSPKLLLKLLFCNILPSYIMCKLPFL